MFGEMNSPFTERESQEMGSAWMWGRMEGWERGIPAAGNACIADVTENSYKLRKTSLFWEVSSGVMERVWGQPGGWEQGIPASWNPSLPTSPALALARTELGDQSSPQGTNKSSSQLLSHFSGIFTWPGCSCCWITDFVFRLEKDLGHPCWSWSSTRNFCQESPLGSSPVAEQCLFSGFLVADRSPCPSPDG